MVQSCCSILSHDPLHHGLSSNSLETGKRGLFCYCRSCKNTSAVLLREHAYSATGNYLKSGSFEIWLHHPGNCIPGGHSFYMQFTRPLLFLLKWVWLTRLNVHLGFLGTQMWLKSRDEQRRPASRRFVHRAPTFSTAETYTMLNAFDMQVSTQVWTKTGIVLQYTDSACFAWPNGEDLTIISIIAKKGPLMKEHPPPTFGPFSCTGSKFTRMSTHPGASFAWSLRSTASSTMRISRKKLIQGIFA